jgi:hypothetical protein
VLFSQTQYRATHIAVAHGSVRADPNIVLAASDQRALQWAVVLPEPGALFDGRYHIESVIGAVEVAPVGKRDNEYPSV